jgi:hypothetical protein
MPTTLGKTVGEEEEEGEEKEEAMEEEEAEVEGGVPDRHPPCRHLPLTPHNRR